MDDPGGDPHHDDADALKKLQQRFALLTGHGDGDPRHDAEDDETKLGRMMFGMTIIWTKLSRTYNVGAVAPFPLEYPGVLVLRQDSCPRHGVILLERRERVSEFD